MAVLLKDMLPGIVKTRCAWHTKLLSHWDTIIGGLNTRVRLEKIQEDTLIIGVYEAHWMQELYLLSQMLIDSINEFLGDRYVAKLRFKLVEERKSFARNSIASAVTMSRKMVVLTNAQKKALESITDEQLKEALTSFWSRCKEREDVCEK